MASSTRNRILGQITGLIVALAIHGLPAAAAIRPAEPVVIVGEELTGLQGAPVEDLHLFSFQDDHWSQIPLQIDERDAGGSWFSPDDGLWDPNDELLFQPRDGGISISDANWIDDLDSYNHSRLRIAVLDPVEGDSTVAYLYRSTTLPDTLSRYYVNYDYAGDEIRSDNYLIGFDDTLWFWDELRLREGDSYGEDLLDREKTRLKGRIIFTWWSRDEEDFTPIQRLVKAGRIRVIRQVEKYVTFLGIDLESSSHKFFYNSYMEVPPEPMEVPAAAGITRMRLSFDLSPAAVGAIESNPANEALLVDGDPDNPQLTLDPAHLHHLWIGIHFGTHSLITVGDYSGLSSQNQLYHHDSAAGGTADGTGDTGDMASYGDIGLLIDNPHSGTHLVPVKTYAAIGEELSGIQCQSWFDSPLEQVISQEIFQPTALPETPEPAMTALLAQNHPNPFNPSTRISFNLQGETEIVLVIFDLNGRLVRTLASGIHAAGEHQLIWDGTGDGGRALASGLYLYRLSAGGDRLQRKMILLR